MTHPESFPGRPRGRRARQDNGGPEWQGQGQVPSDQREFPDLAPIRPQGARERDLRMQGQAGQYTSRHGGPGGHGGGYPAQQPADYPTQQYQAPARPQQPQQQPRQSPGPQPKAEETPSWAEPDSEEAFAERWRRRGREAKQEEDQLKRRKRRRLTIVGAVVVAIAVGVTVDLTQGGPGASQLGFGNFVSSFQKGELQNVPNPCDTMPAATLSAALPGKKPSENGTPMDSGLQTQCTWTQDDPANHAFRVLDVQYIGYSPSGLASGTGSATFAAEDALTADQKSYTFTKALVKNTPGLQSSSATPVVAMPGISGAFTFSATEVVVNNGLTENETFDFIRYRNVIVRVGMQGNSGTSAGKTYQASMSELAPVAASVAKQMTTQIVQKS